MPEHIEHLAESSPPTNGSVPSCTTSLGHVPARRWEFDESVVSVFEDMLHRSIPDIASMRDVVFRTALRFIEPNTDVVDLGCSHGASISKLVEKYGTTNRFVGVDVSVPMVACCRRRFGKEIDQGTVEIKCMDLRRDYPPVKASLSLAILTMQFVPVIDRASLLREILNHTLNGGALLIVEKVLGSTEETDRLMVDLYYEHKRTMGYSPAEIEAKRQSLENVLVPMTARWTEQLLEDVGFSKVECIWRCLNFAGWIAIK